MEKFEELRLDELHDFDGGNICSNVLKMTTNGVLIDNITELCIGIGETFGDSFTRARSWIYYTK